MDPVRFSDDIAARIGGLLTVACPGVERPGLLVALSGGPDSTALLLAAIRWSAETGGALAAAHLHHGLRGEDADGDQDFCADLCQRSGVRLHLRREDPRPVARSRGCGLEEAGRHLRRRFLFSVLEAEPDLHAVATGHHRDDQAETVLMRMLRGTGPDGLRGIRPVADSFIHPLLESGREEILAFLQAAGQPWRQDVTNVEGDNRRARMRRELLPVVRSIFGAGSADAPARLAELLAADLDLLDRWTAEALTGVRQGDGLDVSGLQDLEPALAGRVLRTWLREDQDDDPAADLDLGHVRAALAWLESGTSGTSLDLPGGRRLQRDFDVVRLEGRGTVPARRSGAEYRILVRSGEFPAGHLPGHGDPADEATWSLTCPADALTGNLRVRNWRSGDRMQPFGLDGSKKLSDLFREQRLPTTARQGVLVVEDDAGIVWAVGVARAERTRTSPTTGAAVTMTVIRRDGSPKQGQDTA